MNFNNTSSLIRFGRHLVPTENIYAVDLHFDPQRDQALRATSNNAATSTAGAGVRVWLTPSGLGDQFSIYRPPTYLDFAGQEAQQIRRWCENAAKSGMVLDILASRTMETGGTGGGTQTGRTQTKRKMVGSGKRGRPKRANTISGTTNVAAETEGAGTGGEGATPQKRRKTVQRAATTAA